MDNYKQDEQNNPAPKFDPAGETKKKVMFAIVAFVVIVVLKLLGGF